MKDPQYAIPSISLLEIPLNRVEVRRKMTLQYGKKPQHLDQFGKKLNFSDFLMNLII